MARYKNAVISKDKNGVRYYKSTIVKDIPLKDSDKFVFPLDGERFDSLAQKYYGDSNLWWFIARVNNLKTMNIPAGTSLRIPLTTENATGY